MRDRRPTENHEPIVDEYVGALDVPVQEVILMTEAESFHELAHQWADMSRTKRYQTTLQQTHQIMIHVLKHQIERSYDTQHN